jgi:hypothetical protein
MTSDPSLAPRLMVSAATRLSSLHAFKMLQRGLSDVAAGLDKQKCGLIKQLHTCGTDMITASDCAQFPAN